MTRHFPEPRQIRAARALLGWTQRDLADAAGVELRTVQNMENGRHRPIERTVNALRETLEYAGVEFTNGTRPGVSLNRNE